jgi:hypothetical protein
MGAMLSPKNVCEPRPHKILDSELSFLRGLFGFGYESLFKVIEAENIFEETIN